MGNAEYNRLEKDGQGAAANDGLKLLLQIAAKSEFLAKSRRKGERDSREALQKPLGRSPCAAFVPPPREIGGQSPDPNPTLTSRS